jgi:putative multiple sugar transport system ATP-binding protein
MNVLCGIIPHGEYEGKILFEGKECAFHNIRQSERLGIVIIHQELALIPYLSIGENIFLGNERAGNQIIDWDRTYGEAQKYLQRVRLNEDPHTLIKDIGVGKQQLVEIAKALAKDVKLLILDEPTASLNEDDSQNLLNLLRELKGEGITSILISHKLNEVAAIADSITILRDGATIETLRKGVDDLVEDRIIKGMVGRAMEDRYPPREPHINPEVFFEVRDWVVYNPLIEGRRTIDRVSINVRRGEVVGIAGLMGSGRTEFAMSLFGRQYGINISGEVWKDGKQIDTSTVRKAIDNQIAYVTEDRKTNGLILIDQIRRNISLAKLNKIASRNVLDEDAETIAAEQFQSAFNIKTPSVFQYVGNLSGGNQQKVMLSKWVFTDPEVLILDEPTRGIDVGAKYEIYRIINRIAAEGKCVILISSELPEVLGMCDRIYVMHQGRIVGEFLQGDATQEGIMKRIMDSNREVAA